MAVTINGSAPSTFSHELNFPNVGRRNLLINGAMQVDQRHNGSSWTFAGIQYHTDRWNSFASIGSGHTQQQVSDAPDGFSKSHKITIGTGASPSATDQAMLWQGIEGQDIIPASKFGTSNALNLTASFWVKASIAGTYSCWFDQGDSSTLRGYTTTYTINTANTWEYKTLTIQGCTDGSWLNGDSAGFSFGFDLGSGYEQTPDTWVNTYTRRSSGSVKLIETSGATWQITGVQLEIGSVATPFEHRSYGEELALCQRYYQFLGGYTYQAIGHGRIYSASQTAMVHVPFLQPMRAQPSTVERAGLIVTDRVGFDDQVTSINSVAAGTTSMHARFSTGISRTDRMPVEVSVQNGTAGGIELDAEL